MIIQIILTARRYIHTSSGIRGLTSLRNFQEGHVGDSMREKADGVCGRSKPGREMIFGQKQRHAVMDEAYAVCGFACQDDEVRKAGLDAIESAEPGHGAVHGIDGVLVAGFWLAVRGA